MAEEEPLPTFTDQDDLDEQFRMACSAYVKGKTKMVSKKSHAINNKCDTVVYAPPPNVDVLLENRVKDKNLSPFKQ